MGKPRAPTPPNPQATAAAQTGQNVGTAIAQQAMNNVNQQTPFGGLRFDQTGSYQFRDPNSNAVYDIPTFTATQTLSPAQQRILAQQQQASLNSARIGAEQSARLRRTLNSPLTLRGLPRRGSAPSAPRLQSRLGGAGRVQGGVGGAGRIRRSIAGAGSIQRGVNDVGRLQGAVADAGAVRREIGEAGEITQTYGGDFSAERQRVEDALLARMNPGLQQDREALEGRLASQGIAIGSQAYNDAMADLGRQRNDARLGAILSAGEEQSRLDDLAFRRAGFENAAQQQAFNQAADQAGFENAAQSQRFGQFLDQAELNNAAQQAGFAQEIGRAGLNNSAQNQRFGQLLDQAELNNAAQRERFTQLMGRAALANTAQQQRFDQRLGRAELSNAARARQFAMALQRDQAMDADRATALQERLTLRNQPLNEMAALMSGAQVRTPNFINPSVARLPTTDVAGIINTNYGQRLNRYNTQAGLWRSLIGGLGGLWRSLIGGLGGLGGVALGRLL